MKGGKRAKRLDREKRAAAISFGLITEMAERLDAAGVPPEKAPGLDEAIGMVWDLARELARLEQTAKDAGVVAARARAATLDVVTGHVAAAARPVPVSGPRGLEARASPRTVSRWGSRA